MWYRNQRLTYRMANFRGFSDKTGNRAKQITKHANAARLQPPNMSSRSHLLTANDTYGQYDLRNDSLNLRHDNESNACGQVRMQEPPSPSHSTWAKRRALEGRKHTRKPSFLFLAPAWGR